MLSTGPFPDFKNDISEDYKLVVADYNSLRKQRKYIHRIILFIHYFMCFMLGYNMSAFHSKFIISLFWFLGYLILTFFIVVLIHQLLRCLTFPLNTWKRNCYIGFNKKYLTPYCYCKRELSKFRLILGAIFPFVLLTVFPLGVIINIGGNTLVYAIAYSNAIISSFDIYDIYILVRKISGWKKPILKSANRYFIVIKK